MREGERIDSTVALQRLCCIPEGRHPDPDGSVIRQHEVLGVMREDNQTTLECPQTLA